ncbi:MAG: sigma-70 family RNA polymerase sigma factor [Pirellulales bacterium]|nr:sigma-70 family RNA polymerase sigma factor [Pirellulales bacterium]
MIEPPERSEFVRLWVQYGQRIYAHVLTLTSNDADADEIYQDVGMMLWEKFDQFTPGTNFLAWARQVALNKVRNFRRLKHRQAVLYSPEFFDAVDRVTANNAEALEAQRKALANCLGKLPERHQDLIRRRYQPGATPDTVASQTGRNVKAIYEALRRIHQVLFDCVRRASLGEGTL